MAKKLTEENKKIIKEALGKPKKLHPMAVHVVPTGEKNSKGHLRYKAVAHGSKVHKDYVSGELHEPDLDDLSQNGFKVKVLKKG